MAHFRTVEEQLRVIVRGVVDLVSEAELSQRLKQSRDSGRPLRVKLGIDPSSPDIHVGHTVVLRKLRDFQRLGHIPIVLWGTATAMVGDPSGRDKTRPSLTRDQVSDNKQTYKAQVGKILAMDAIEERENGEWFDRMDFMAGVRLASRYTVAQILDRDSFKERYTQGIPISVHEMLYPLMQGWDSVELKADIELGGTDQLFNLIVGRELQKQQTQPPQVCITVPLLEGLDGVMKMSKSLGNYIGVTDSPTEMFGKSMSIPDPLMEKYFTLLTDLPDDQIRSLLSGHPREAKVRLGKCLVTDYHGADAAESAASEFDRVHKKGGLPDKIRGIRICEESVLLVDALVRSGLCSTKSEGRRLIDGGGIRVSRVIEGSDIREAEVLVVDLPNHLLEKGTYIVRRGKRKAVRITVDPMAARTETGTPGVTGGDPPEKK